MTLRFPIQRKSKKFLLFCVAAALIAGAGYLIYDKFFAQKMMIASINPYNFSYKGISDLYVNGTWGGNSYARTGGGSSVCCVLVPEKWRPGLVVNVKWQRDDNGKWYTAQPEIPRYTESAGLQVMFLENDQVKVYLMDYWPCTPKHPMSTSKLCNEEKND